jgi:hypothetical protein
MSTVDTAPVAAPFRGHTCRALYQAIYDADAPEQVVRQLPAQSLFMVVKERGLESSADLLTMASLEQCRLMSDFDLWHGDSIDEENLWRWLSITDETDSLELLQKFVKYVDLKVIALLISRYVDVQVFDEPTDQPPGPGFHTPDKGSTWIGIKTENPDHHFLLARLLALIFESSTEVFYQLLATPGVATVSMLEEEAFLERTKRLAAEGVPEPEVAAVVHAPYSLQEAHKDIHDKTHSTVIEDIRSIEPLVYEARSTRLFAELLKRVADHESVEMEFTFIMNAAVVRWGIDFSDQARVLELAEQVKGAINIALERLSHDGSTTITDAYDALGLGKLFRLGLTELMALRSKARKMTLENLEKLQQADSVLFSTVACAREAFPMMPLFLNEDGSLVEEGEGKLIPGTKPIGTVKALATVKSLLEKAAA